MRLCRFGDEVAPQVGFFAEEQIIPLTEAVNAFTQSTGRRLELPSSAELLAFLPPDGVGFSTARELAAWIDSTPLPGVPIATTQLLIPIPRPNTIFLLAGNYAEHIREGGGMAAERAETFPYVFMKPPSTTLTHSGRAIKLPLAAPDAVDWELELAVVIGRRAKHVSEADALSFVAGYTIVNDISQRRFRPNPNRKKREKDAFFDWLHGKWFDTFCPCGPCITSSDSIPDPQSLRMRLELNGDVRQDASTAQQIFPVAAVIEFISQMVTLEPGDIISTGTPAGVGSTTGTFLKPGDVMHGSIEKIGTLVTPVEAEAATR
ncbi:MAG: fumarylacetoacetate hydrolase family protein [Planctomycetia bacterium]|nr:fumarylacetoacetate hydrolase family protein [Planctomycetia bacterium]